MLVTERNHRNLRYEEGKTAKRSCGRAVVNEKNRTYSLDEKIAHLSLRETTEISDRRREKLQNGAMDVLY